jgi:hypothetical protein
MTEWWKVYIVDENKVLKQICIYPDYDKVRDFSEKLFCYEKKKVFIKNNHQHWYEVRVKKNINFSYHNDIICWEPTTSKHLNTNYTFK